MKACIKIVNRSVMSLLVVLAVQIYAMGQAQFAPFSQSAKPFNPEIQKHLRAGKRLTIDPDFVHRIYQTEPASFVLVLPMPGGENRRLLFEKERATSEDFIVETSDGRSFSGKQYSGVQYRLARKEGAVGAISFSAKEMSGVFADDYSNWNLGPLPNGNGDYVLYAERDLDMQSGFHCETEDKAVQGTLPGRGLGTGQPSVQATGTCRVVRLYFECDFKMYQDNGNSVSGTTTRITSIVNVSKQLLTNEQVDVELARVFVWTSTDPYASYTASTNYLFNFATDRNATMTENLGHFVSTRSTSLGGLAYVDGLCGAGTRFAYSNIFNTFNPLPNYSWSVSCITHEMGHNLGSRHTHWCGWQLTPTTIGRIDSCAAGESVFGAVNCTSTTKINYNGTIMSYCHTNGNINFNRGFGPLPGNLIRQRFAAATCLTGASVSTFTVSGTRVICEGGNVSLSASTSVTGGTFSWTGPNGFTSSAQSPSISSATPAASGQYECTMSKGGCTSDPRILQVVVNDIQAPPVSEGFQGTFPAPGWRISNPNADRTFTQNNTVGGFGASSSCISFDNYNMPFTNGRRDTLFLPVFNLSGFTSASFQFDLANAWNGFTYDSLSVIVSTNCGRTFSRIYRKTGTALATAPNNSNPFVPTSSQWRKETIDLSAYAGQGQVQLAFVNVSGSSNFIFLDNINVTASGGGGGPSITMAALPQSSYCPGAAFSLNFTPGGTFGTGNVFTAQLSNATGSFSSPTTIGSGSGSPLAVTIPAGTANGSGYQIRIVASNPSTTSLATTAFSVAPLTVTAGADQTICANGSAVTLTGNPAGGTWSGSGVTAAGVFTPTTALVGNRTLTYSLSSGGCSGSDAVVMTVNAVPAANAGSDFTTCTSSPAFSLTGFSPSGGTWSGNGVNAAGIFTPSPALLGNQTLTYSVTTNGCTGTDTRVVTVSSSVTVSAGASQTVCSNGSPLTLSGTPAGGTWSGSGVSALGTFTPSSGLAGNQILTYTVSGTCGGSSQVTIQVNAAPTVSAGADRLFCDGDAAASLTQGSPAGGTWSGTGVSGNTFDPSSAGVGTQTLTYTFVQNGCSASDLVDFTVNAVPAPVTGPNRNTCVNSAAFALTATPSGGTWSGPGVSGTGIFTPSAALAGTQNLTYSLSQNGCTGTATQVVHVNNLPVVLAGPDLSASSNDGPVSLSGSPAGGIWSGTGVNGNVFTPSSTGPGNFTLTYTFTENGCPASDDLIFVVTPGVDVSAGADQTVCSDASPLLLTGSPAGGTWSGPGVDASGLFNPSGLNGAQTLTYTVSGTGSDDVVIQVVPTPVVSAGSDQSVCNTAAAFSLTGSPAGGTWSGTGITSSGQVTPAQLLAGGSSFTYSYSIGGCSGTDEVVITGVTPPVVNAGTNQSVCKNASPLQLTGIPAGGNWSGTGVSATGVFDPANVSSGAKTLTYTVEGAIAGCSGSDQVVITVFNIPTVSAGSDRSTCSNSAPVQLTGTPSGGVWSGPGINGTGLFTPSSSLVGIQTLSYSVTQNGCTNTSTLNVTVNALPVVSTGSPLSLCTNSSTFSLSAGTPAGGTWSGASFVNAGGTCTGPFSAGNFTLVYTVSQNGCQASATLPVTVSTVPVVNAGTNRSVCSNGNSLTLNGFSPSGGIWTGNGVSGTGVFSPSAALTGVQTLTYSVTQNGCTGSDQLTVTVKAIPNIVTGATETACASGVRFKINGYQPRGGTWSGPGIQQDSFFVPSPALTGVQTITYSVTRNGCTASDQKTVTITPSNTITAGTFPPALCANEAPVTFTGFLPAGGIFKGPGITENGLFTPAAALTGTQTLVYRSDLNGCRDSVTVQTLVKAVPVVSAGSDLTACATGAAFALTGASPAGGVWSGSGVSDSGLFNPISVTAGMIPLTYSFTDNGCTGSDNLMVNVTAAPAVNAGNDRNICRNSVPVQLVGVPAGGTWSGTGISADGLFTPTGSMSGNLTLVYTYNQGGCDGTDQMVVSITNPVSVTAGPAQTVCSGDNSFLLSGFSPSGGTWSGPGVTPAGQFNPDNLLVGTQTLVYRVTASNCTVTASKTITVNSTPLVTAGSDLNICSNSPAVTLTGFSPAGGTWTGTGVSTAGVVTPSPSGTQVITYSVTAGGCTGTASRVITFIPAPVVDAGPQQIFCGLNSPGPVTGFFPSNGVWSGPGINSQGVFTPLSSQLGTAVDVSYTVTQNGCSSTATKSLLVVNIPSTLSINSATTQSCEGSPIALSLPVGSGFAIRWFRNNVVIPGASQNIYNAGSSGSYKAEISLSGCAAESQAQDITLNPVPAAPVIALSGNQLTSSVSSGVTWRRNGQAIPGATGAQYTPVQSGIYTAVVTAAGCESPASNSITYMVTDVADDMRAGLDISVYPNPNEGRFFVRIKGERQAYVQMHLINAIGQTVWSSDKVGPGPEILEESVQAEGLPAGVYWFRLETGKSPLLQKVVIR